MADVPLSIAAISTISPVVAGAIPVIVGWIRDSGRDKREQAERAATERVRLEQEKRGECVTLLRLAREFRVLMENANDARGSDLTAYAREVREAAANITVQADEVELTVFAAATAANALATEARTLAAQIADLKNREYGAPLVAPNFTVFDRRLVKFKTAAQAAFGYPATSATEDAPDLQAEVVARQESLELRELPSFPG